MDTSFVVADWDGQLRLSGAPPGPTPSARDLEVRPVPLRTARAFVERFHYLGYAPPGARVCLGVWRGDRLAGVLMFGRPSARLEDQRASDTRPRRPTRPSPRLNTPFASPDPTRTGPAGPVRMGRLRSPRQTPGGARCGNGFKRWGRVSAFQDTRYRIAVMS